MANTTVSPRVNRYLSLPAVKAAKAAYDAARAAAEVIPLGGAGRLEALGRAADAAVAYADAIRAAIEADTRAREAAKDRCLVIRVPSDNIPAWQGGVGERRRLAEPGRAFTGTEGHTGKHEGRTGWYRPVGWVTLKEAAGRLTVWDNEVHEGQSEEDYRTQTVRDYFAASGPEDFPGLAEHYGELPWLCGCGKPATTEIQEGWNPALNEGQGGGVYAHACDGCWQESQQQPPPPVSGGGWVVDLDSGGIRARLGVRGEAVVGAAPHETAVFPTEEAAWRAAIPAGWTGKPVRPVY